MTPGSIVLVVAVLLALAFGLWRARTDGRFGTSRAAAATSAPLEGPVPAEQAAGAPGAEDPSTPAPPAHVGPVNLLRGTEFADRLGTRATLLQFSSAFCAPCRVTRRTLAEVAEVVPGVVHLEVDAEAHLDLVRQVGVLRTPTTLVLDEHGVEISRAAGAPRKEQVLAALGHALG